MEGMEEDVVKFNKVVEVKVMKEKGNIIKDDWKKRIKNN